VGRIVIGVVLMVIVMVAVISAASSDLIHQVASLSRKGRLLLAAGVCLIAWGGWFYYNNGFDYLLWLYHVPTRPADERAFVGATEQALHAWSAEQNAGARDRLCHDPTRVRAKAEEVSHWTGTVSTVYQLGTRAVLVVRIGRHTDLRTSFNDAAGAVLLDRGTPAFEQVAALRSGDPVRVSGRLMPGADRCMFDAGTEASEPGAQILFRFTAVEAADR
jgi:hypothetical protein